MKKKAGNMVGAGQCIEPEDEANAIRDGAKQKNWALDTTYMLLDQALPESFLDYSDL